MEIQQLNQEQGPTLTLSGPLDASGAAALLRALTPLLRKKQAVLVDLSGVPSADSAGVDKLAVTWTEVGEENKERIASILTNADRAAHQLAKTSKKVSKASEGSLAALEQTLNATANAAKSIHRAVNNLNPGKTLGAITGAADSFKKRMEDPALDKTISALNHSASRLSGLTTELRKVVKQRDRQLGSIMSNIDRASEYLKSFSQSIKERPSLLLRGNTRKERDIP